MNQFFASYGALIGTFAGGLLLFIGGRYLNRANATKTLVDTAMGFVDPLNKKVEELEKNHAAMLVALETAQTDATTAKADAAAARAEAAHAVEEAARANARADRAESHLRQAVDILTQRQIPVPAEWTVAS